MKHLFKLMFILSSILVVIFLLSGFFAQKALSELIQQSGWVRYYWIALAFNVFFWFAQVILILFKFLLDRKSREKILAKVLKSEERDEREVYNIGLSFKYSYYLNITIMLMFFIFSFVHYNSTQEFGFSIAIHPSGYLNHPTEISLLKWTVTEVLILLLLLQIFTPKILMSYLNRKDINT